MKDYPCRSPIVLFRSSCISCFVDSLPGLNFAFHCGGGVTPQHPYLLRCPAIEEGITTCQQNGKKVLLSLGGSTGGNVLGSADIAVQFANTLWQLFLGGNEANISLRPFGTYVPSMTLLATAHA